MARSKATGVSRVAKIVWRYTFEDERPFRREFEGIEKFKRLSREHTSQLNLFHIGRNDAEGNFYHIMELADNLGSSADYVPHTLRGDLLQGRLPAKRVLEMGLTLPHRPRDGRLPLEESPCHIALTSHDLSHLGFKGFALKPGCG